MKTVSPWATRHRPRRFDEVVGQETAIAQLKGAIKRGSLPNALLLCGPSGTGKTTLARLFAKYANCETHKACGKCDSCLAFKVRHPDVEEVNAATARGIDEVRDLVNRARYKPQFNTRIFIVDEAHQFTPQAMQAFLKPLEEPPPNTLYILCTTDPQKFPNTVVNRCLVVPVALPKASDIVDRLKHIAEREKIAFPEKLYAAIASASHGHVREAVNALESAANVLASDPKVALEKLLQTIAQQADTNTQEAAQAFVLALYTGKSKLAVRAAFGFQDAVAAINHCIWLNEYSIAKTTGTETSHVFHSPANRSFWSTVSQKHSDVPVRTMLDTQRRLVVLRNALTSGSTKDISTLLAHL